MPKKTTKASTTKPAKQAPHSEPAKKPEEEQLRLLRGMKDILPRDQAYWDYIRKTVSDLAQDYCFRFIDTPILEKTSLFTRSVGEETDIVAKEMFSFVDRGGENVSLRPENTASVARAYIEHGMVSCPQPVKLYYFGPFFRHDRPQAGRYRQFYQFGFESLGGDSPIIDAQMIVMVKSLYEQIGLETEIQVNSVGCPSCRPEYEKLLVDYFKSKRRFLCEDCKKRLLKNPLRLLDCKNQDCQEIAGEAPQSVDHLDEECRDHFVKVLEYLDGAEMSYNLNPCLVRGLDYYTRTAFEVWAPGKGGHQNALGGGGRYDNLINQLGGRPTPACGFAGGVERLIMVLKENDVQIPKQKPIEVYLAQLGESARKKALKLYEELRRAGIKISGGFSEDGLRPQLSEASKLGVAYTLILGQKEILDNTILIRDMENGSQEVADYKKIVEEVRKRLDKSTNGLTVKKI